MYRHPIDLHRVVGYELHQLLVLACAVWCHEKHLGFLGLAAEDEARLAAVLLDELRELLRRELELSAQARHGGNLLALSQFLQRFHGLAQVHVLSHAAIEMLMTPGNDRAA